jgi:hypothetical protein
MTHPNHVFAGRIDALRGRLRPCERAPRPIDRPETGQDATFGGRR